MKHFLWLLLCVALVAPGQAQADKLSGRRGGLWWPAIKRGASGPRVVALQFLLRARGYNLKPDGKFAYATERVVRKFQANNGLQVDGKIGWQSWTALTPNLKRGAKGDAVRALQTLLVFQEQQVACDGSFGEQTERALRRAERRLGLSGELYEVDKDLWSYLSGGGFFGD